MKAPFPYFGGKSKIASTVWRLLGDVDHYLEPFFGSGAVLLNRPNYDPKKHTETVCDADGFLCNVWRSIKYAPEKVAIYCDNPVNHIDLVARRKYLADRVDLVEKLAQDPEWFDAKIAGYWIWCKSCWIGREVGLLMDDTDKPTLGQIPYLASKGKGSNKISLIPDIHANIVKWLKSLSERLRLVRVVYGDWSRICNGNWQDKDWKTVGVYLDPPYSSKSRDSKLYVKESLDVAKDVAEWAYKRGNKPNYRIVISAYEDEECYHKLLEHGWNMIRWTANGGYGNMRKAGTNENRRKEALYYNTKGVAI